MSDGAVSGRLTPDQGTLARDGWRAGGAVTTSNLYLAMDSGHDQLTGPPGPAVLATQLLGRTRRNATLDDSMSLQFTGIASSSAGAGPVTGRIRASARELLGGVRHAAGSPSFLRADGIFRGQYLVLRGLAGITFRPAGH
ncbi:hypothetical protein ACWEPC_36130 [Nonomuraea sp. NPDC004297]